MTRPTANMDLTRLLDALQIGQWLPETYAAWRPLLLDGLQFFFSQLTPARQAQLVATQLQLPPNASPAVRLVTVLRQCPTLHKLGQVVARDGRLDPELRRNLQTLESLESGPISPDLTALIQRELGAAIADLTIAPTALAEASVAVVVPVRWSAGESAALQDGVLKVLRPGVEAELQEELKIWASLGWFLEECGVERGLPPLDYRNTLESVGRLLAHEIQLDQEQAHLARAAAFYIDAPTVLVPALLPFCTPRITAMERVYGHKVTDQSWPPAQRRRLAITLGEALLAKPFWSNDPVAIFHADPHAGNLLATDDGRLAILDWALTIQVSKAQRVAVVQAVVSGLIQDLAGLSQALYALGRCPDPKAMQEASAAALQRVRQGQFPGMAWLMELLDRLGTAGLMQFPEELTLFRKALLTVTGVISDVSGQPGLDETLIWAGLAQCLRELPGRGLAAPDSRAFGSHLSNADWLNLWAALPTTLTRYGWGICQDALAAAGVAASGRPAG